MFLPNTKRFCAPQPCPTPQPGLNVPLVDSGTGSAGTDYYHFAMADHVHPAEPQPEPATELPLADAPVALVGTSLKYAREDHVHPAQPLPEPDSIFLTSSIYNATNNSQYLSRWIPTYNENCYIPIPSRVTNPLLSNQITWNSHSDMVAANWNFLRSNSILVSGVPGELDGGGPPFPDEGFNSAVVQVAGKYYISFGIYSVNVVAALALGKMVNPPGPSTLEQKYSPVTNDYLWGSNGGGNLTSNNYQLFTGETTNGKPTIHSITTSTILDLQAGDVVVPMMKPSVAMYLDKTTDPYTYVVNPNIKPLPPGVYNSLAVICLNSFTMFKL